MKLSNTILNEFDFYPYESNETIITMDIVDCPSIFYFFHPLSFLKSLKLIELKKIKILQTNRIFGRIHA